MDLSSIAERGVVTLTRDHLGAGLVLAGLIEIVILTPTPWIGRLAVVIGIALIVVGVMLFFSEPP